MRSLLALFVLVVGLASARSASAERAAIIAVDLGGGAPAFMRDKALSGVKDGLVAAGFEVVSLDQTAPKISSQNLTQCRTGPCLTSVGKAVDAALLVIVTITRKDESTIIVIRLIDANSTNAIAEVHEVCDLCGQSELDDRINVAASDLRVKAEAARQRRDGGGGNTAPSIGAPIRVAVVPLLTVNVEPAQADALGQDLADALNDELEVEAAGGLEVRRQLPADLPPNCPNTPACAADIAKRTNANQLLFLVLSNTSTNGSILVDSTWVDPASGQTATRRPVDVPAPDKAKATFASAAKQLLPGARPRQKGGNGGFGGTMTPAIPRHFTTQAKIAAAAGVVGLGLGIGFGVKMRGKYNDCEAMPGTCSQADKDSIRTLGFVADFGFVVAIGGAITAGIMYATSGEESHLTVEAKPGGAAVMWGSSF